MAGLAMETIEPESDYESSDAEPDAQNPMHNLVLQPEGSVDENQDTVNMPQTAVPAGKAGHVQRQDNNGAASVPKRKRRRTGGIQEGTYIGGGCRMMCYCPKHSHVTQRKLQAHMTPVPIASAVVPQSMALSCQQHQQETAQPSVEHDATAHVSTAAGIAVPQQVMQMPQHKAGCIRGVPFNHACRRGQREPDAIAAALAKRHFVSKTPYLIGAAQQHMPSAMPAAQLHASEQAFLQQQQPSKDQQAGIGHSRVLTQTERFKEMQQSVGRRLTCGKSAIHGLGAFTKLPHQAGKICCAAHCTHCHKI